MLVNNTNYAIEISWDKAHGIYWVEISKGNFTIKGFLREGLQSWGNNIFSENKINPCDGDPCKFYNVNVEFFIACGR